MMSLLYDVTQDQHVLYLLMNERIYFDVEMTSSRLIVFSEIYGNNLFLLLSTSNCNGQDLTCSHKY